jgi:hypothetical protein
MSKLDSSQIYDPEKDEGKVIWSSESYDGGTGAQDNLMKVFTEVLHIKTFAKEDEDNHTQFEKVRVRRTTQEEDENGKGDFVIYRPDTNTYIHFDLTTAVDPEVIEYKEGNITKLGLPLLRLKGNVIKQALRGCSYDIEKVKSKVGKYVLGLA